MAQSRIYRLNLLSNVSEQKLPLNGHGETAFFRLTYVCSILSSRRVPFGCQEDDWYVLRVLRKQPQGTTQMTAAPPNQWAIIERVTSC